MGENGSRISACSALRRSHRRRARPRVTRYCGAWRPDSTELWQAGSASPTNRNTPKRRAMMVPTPHTRSSAAVDSNAPPRPRSATMARARTGPIPGTARRSSSLALFRGTGSPCSSRILAGRSRHGQGAALPTAAKRHSPAGPTTTASSGGAGGLATPTSVAIARASQTKARALCSCGTFGGSLRAPLPALRSCRARMHRGAYGRPAPCTSPR